jgi:hypothetical protein
MWLVYVLLSLQMCSVLRPMYLSEYSVLDSVRQKNNKVPCHLKYEQKVDFCAYLCLDKTMYIVAWNVWTYNKVTLCVQAESESN